MKNSTIRYYVLPITIPAGGGEVVPGVNITLPHFVKKITGIAYSSTNAPTIANGNYTGDLSLWLNNKKKLVLNNAVMVRRVEDRKRKNGFIPMDEPVLPNCSIDGHFKDSGKVGAGYTLNVVFRTEIILQDGQHN